MTEGLIIFAAGAGLLGFVLAAAARYFGAKGDDVATQIERLLPHIQCAKCGYPGCFPYALAIAEGVAPINRCPPGGQETIDALAVLLGEGAQRLDPAFAEPPGPPPASVSTPSLNAAPVERIAFIDENRCVGCALCLPACPVDAIIGAPRYTHTVIASECTGCELCLPPCPVDCIELIESGLVASGVAPSMTRGRGR